MTHMGGRAINAEVSVFVDIQGFNVARSLFGQGDRWRSCLHSRGPTGPAGLSRALARATGSRTLDWPMMISALS